MGFEVKWTPKAIKTFDSRISYLRDHWTEKEIFQFTKRVNDFLENLKTQPLMFRKSKRLKNIHIGLIIKEVSLVYRVNSKENIIELITFIDNRQNPKQQAF